MSEESLHQRLLNYTFLENNMFIATFLNFCTILNILKHYDESRKLEYVDKCDAENDASTHPKPLSRVSSTTW